MEQVTPVTGRSRAISDLDARKLRHMRRQVVMLTQGELADAAGISRGEISHLETGKRKPLASTLKRLCVALGCQPDDLLSSGQELPVKQPHRPVIAQPDGPGRPPMMGDGHFGRHAADTQQPAQSSSSGWIGMYPPVA